MSEDVRPEGAIPRRFYVMGFLMVAVPYYHLVWGLPIDSPFLPPTAAPYLDGATGELILATFLASPLFVAITYLGAWVLHTYYVSVEGVLNGA